MSALGRRRVGLGDAGSPAGCWAWSRRWSSRRWRWRIRSATSRSTTTRGCASRPTASTSTSSSTAPRSRRSRSAATLDADADGELSRRELDAVRVDGCSEVAGRSVPHRLRRRARTAAVSRRASRSRPATAACRRCGSCARFEAPFSNPLAAATTLAFRDDFMAERIGWREIVVQGDGATVAGEAATTTVSARLVGLSQGPHRDAARRPRRDDHRHTRRTRRSRRRPSPMRSPLARRAGRVVVRGPAPVDRARRPTVAPRRARRGAARRRPRSPAASRASRRSSTTDRLDPLLVFVALLTAAALGAGHALTPGHGKTLMAAYLVGTRGTALPRAGLGLSVSLSAHARASSALALVVVGAQQALPPDVVVRAAPVDRRDHDRAIGGVDAVHRAPALARPTGRATRCSRSPDHDHDA